MKYAIITENDQSQWKDETGEQYHFPKRYLDQLTEGTKVVYYKGKRKDLKYKDHRLTDLPHYFGIATIGKRSLDNESDKEDYFCEILDFVPFGKPVLAKQLNGDYLENIPANRISNYWRDGVRKASKELYEKIIELSDLQIDGLLNDSNQGLELSFESILTEGKQLKRFSSIYERKAVLRQQAILIHGYTCKACGFNFKDVYGELGNGFIHVHHLNPLSESGEMIINPSKDLTVLCANCHSMVHRYRNKIISIEEIREIIKKRPHNNI